MDKITKIDIVTRKNNFEELKEELGKIGVTGMTVTQVLGCGIQKGDTQYYRGVPMETKLIPKLKIEIVVSEVPVEKVVEVAQKVLRTGKIGDGKIFIYDVSNVIKIRTGESGIAALQDK
ncbi:P-II family nitrogen regulator [Clostridium bornimense]|uniref:P-II family nitrogen regulator n=1 Tax=Clostridium bornimense TaxID=1216932 RepID=UPI001C10B6E5|nr:P-II family nitrogen regulator [Clostridium bornimense]MBU5315335.1 P-II family nitrogen regulator [Clostridium bornimense]